MKQIILLVDVFELKQFIIQLKLDGNSQIEKINWKKCLIES